ncbi:MAG: protein kinase [Gemmataceae bacterium]
MIHEERLNELLIRWEERFEAGEEDTPEELCRDCPKLAAALKQRIRLLKNVAWVNDCGRDEQLRPSTPDALPEPTLMGSVVRPGMEPLPGYRLLHRLGAGGFGQVWEAETPSGRRLAVKLIPGIEELSGAAHSEIELEGLQRMMGVRSPWKLWTERYEMVGNWLIIVSQLADGTLRDYLRERNQSTGVTLAECVSMLRDLADFLDLLNLEHELIHGDIKPNNLLMVEGVCVASDFGCVIPVGLRPYSNEVVICYAPEGGQNQVKTVAYRSAAAVPWREVPAGRASLVTNVGCFTPDYAPPEAFEGRSSRSFDQYCLALTFCDLAFGELPFRGTLADQLAQRKGGAVNDSFLPDSLRPPLVKALSAVPEQRFSTCQEFMDAIREGCLPLVRNCPRAVEHLDW